MKDIRIRRRKLKNGGMSYMVVMGDESYGSYPTRKLADARKLEVRENLYNLTDKGLKETRKVSDLAGAWLKRAEEGLEASLRSGEWHQKWSRSPETVKHYRDRIRRFIIPRLGDELLITLERQNLEDAIKWVWENVSALQARSVSNMLKAMIRWGAAEGWSFKQELLNCLPSLIAPPRSDPSKKRLPTLESLQKIFAVLYGPRKKRMDRRTYLHARAVWTVGVANGMRKSEIAALKWENIFWDQGFAFIDGSYSRALKGAKGTKTRSSMRKIWLPRQSLEALQDINRLIENGATEGFVFRPGKGGRTIMNSMQETIMRRVLIEAGIPREESEGVIHFHAMRHYCNSHMAELGVSREARKANLGHSSRREVHDDYTHLPAIGSEAQWAAQVIIDALMPANPVPAEEGMRVYHYSLKSPEERRTYWRLQARKWHAEHPGYATAAARRARAARKALPAPADTTRTRAKDEAKNS